MKMAGNTRHKLIMCKHFVALCSIRGQTHVTFKFSYNMHLPHPHPHRHLLNPPFQCFSLKAD